MRPEIEVKQTTVYTTPDRLTFATLEEAEKHMEIIDLCAALQGCPVYLGNIGTYDLADWLWKNYEMCKKIPTP